MSLELKCLNKLNVTLTEISLWMKFHKNWNVTKKLKFQSNWNVTNWNALKLVFQKTKLSLKLNCHLNWKVTWTEISLKLKYKSNLYDTETEISLNWNVTETEMPRIINCHWKWNVWIWPILANDGVTT